MPLRPNVVRVTARNKPMPINVVGGAHIGPIAVAAKLKIVPAYPTILVARVATAHLVKNERHEASLGAVRRVRVYEIMDRRILDAFSEHLVKKRGTYE